MGEEGMEKKGEQDEDREGEERKKENHPESFGHLPFFLPFDLYQLPDLKKEATVPSPVCQTK